MLKPRTLKLLVLILAVYGLLLLLVLARPPYLESPIGLLVIVPGLSVYVFHKLGIPGLLEHNGLCGWGWCAPTAFGWLFIVVFWLAIAWLLAWTIASLTKA